MFTIVLLLLFTVLCVLLSGDGAWDNVTKPERNSLVFDGRHRGYGAFVLRREYDRRFILAFVGALGVMGLAVAVPKVMAMMGMNMPPAGSFIPPIGGEHKFKVVPMELPETKPKSEPEPPAPAPKPAPVPAITPAPVPGFVEPTDSLLITDPGPAPGPKPEPGPPVGGGPQPPIGGDPGTGGGPSSPFTTEKPADQATVDVLPEFYGGHAAMTRFIQDNLQLRDDDITSAKEWVSFVVDSDGTVVRVRAKGRASRDFGEAAERVVRAMPKWKPAKYHGQEVPCVLVLPIELNTQ